MFDRVLAVAATAGFLLVSGGVALPGARSAVLPPVGPALAAGQSDRVLVKFRAGVRMRLRQGTLVSLTGAGTQEVATAFAAAGASPPRRLFRQGEAGIDRDRAAIQARSGQALPDLNSYFALTTAPGLGSALAGSLRSLAVVETAYLAPQPAPPPSAGLAFVAAQGYREAAPTGVGADYAATFPGATGNLVKLIDVEYGWNRSHEDLTKAADPGALIANGTPLNPFPDDHGTAVLGQIVGDANELGVTGLAPDVSLGLVNAWNREAGPVIADAINLARQHLSPGDVLLIEQQSEGLHSAEYLPAEWDPAVYDAIRLASAAGIVVVEPAGNGSVDLDDPAYGAPFPMGKPDSGALIVGAGAAGDCRRWDGPARSRLPFSNHGSRVDLQGWGECVATTGFGDLTADQSDPNGWYTGAFSGTSSAAALVAAAAAALQSAHKTLNGGAALQPAEVREILVQTGTPQDLSSPDAAAGHIGPLPNLSRALPRVDLTAPTTPADLTVSAGEAGQPLLRWTAAVDNVASGYEIYRDGALLAEIGAGGSAGFEDATAAPGTGYTYAVRAVDEAGNGSPLSNAATLAFPAAPIVEGPPAPQPPPSPALTPPPPEAISASATSAGPAAPPDPPTSPTPRRAAAPTPPPRAPASPLAPTLSGLRAAPARLVARRSRRTITIRFSLSTPAPVWLTVSARPMRGKALLLGRLRVAGQAGRNTVAFRGRPLPAGAYAIAVTGGALTGSRRAVGS